MAVFTEDTVFRGSNGMIYTVTLNPALDKEYHVAELSLNTVMRAAAVKEDYGGKGFNIARLLTTWGADCTALGLVGGHTGEILSSGLEKSGIAANFTHISGETRTNISIVSDHEAGYFKVNEPGPRVLEVEIETLLHLIKSLVKPDDWWILAGSLPPGVEPDIYARMIHLIQNRKGRAVLDSSGEAFKLGCRAAPFLIKPNTEEFIQFSEMEGREEVLDIEGMIKQLHTVGVKNIILSGGKEKAICSNGTQMWVGIPPKIEEKNPIGAGDAMLAAAVYSLSRNEPLQDAFMWGMAAGSAAAGLSGTRMPARPEVEKLIKKVMIREK